jgi:hypothetical protein
MLPAWCRAQKIDRRLQQTPDMEGVYPERRRRMQINLPLNRPTLQRHPLSPHPSLSILTYRTASPRSSGAVEGELLRGASQGEGELLRRVRAGRALRGAEEPLGRCRRDQGQHRAPAAAQASKIWRMADS